MKRVLLIDMPFGDVRLPSLALGLFKAKLESQGIGCDVENLKLLFAGMIGWENYIWLSSLTALLAGERTFARTFFGVAIPSDAEYASYVGGCLLREDLQRLRALGECVAPFLETCLATIAWNQYDIIGFTCMFEQNAASLALAYEVKRRFPGKIIVFGGANCEDRMGLTLHGCFPFIDYVCRGEADSSFPELVDRLARGRSVDTVPGIVYRDGICSVSTGAPPVTADLDALPFPNYDDYFRALHTYSVPAAFYPTVLCEASRGCWWGQKVKCTFCGLNGIAVASRCKSARRVLDEIDWLVRRYGARYIRMVDNMLHPDHLGSLLPELARKNFGVRYFWEIRPTLRKEDVKLLAMAGVRDAQVGIENLSTNALRLMRKGSTSLAGVQTLKWCKQYGVSADWNLLYGFPGEQPADYARNLELVRLLTHLNPPSTIGRFRMDRFSASFEHAAALGLVDVRPNPIHRFIYPFPEETLFNLAYFFDFRYRARIDDGGCAGQLHSEVEAWKARREQLTAMPVGDSLVVDDSRAVAPAPRITLSGTRKALLEYCDRAQTVDRLAERFGTENSEAAIGKQEIKAILEEFVRGKLMIQEGSWYLSLPVMVHLE
jgi:ribosomal peptide maturation radical SAM protein 1